MKLEQEINRIKSLFTEERLYGNLIKEQVDEPHKGPRFFACLDDYKGVDKNWCILIAKDGASPKKSCGQYKYSITEQYRILYHGRTIHRKKAGDDELQSKMQIIDKVEFSLEMFKKKKGLETGYFELIFKLLAGQAEGENEHVRMTYRGQFKCGGAENLGPGEFTFTGGSSDWDSSLDINNNKTEDDLLDGMFKDSKFTHKTKPSPMDLETMKNQIEHVMRASIV
jgi:hypothetical protein